MKKGFTMIELIFVIVILGILASVAIPRLAATRDDANIAKALSEVSTLVADIGSYYTSQGNFNGVSSNTAHPTAAQIQVMTNVADISTLTAANSFAYQTPGNDGTLEDCIEFVLTTDGNMTISENNSTTLGNICTGLQSSGAMDDLIGAHKFGGRKVNF